jgi:hydrogenase maturation protease
MLVLGVGSELRSDDAAGRHVADAVARAGFDDVEVVSVHQLTPELALDLAGRDRVVIVDAAVDVTEVTVSEIEPVAGEQPFSHHLGPGTLVALAGRLGTAPGSVVVVSVPVHDLALGTELSEPTARAVEVASARVLSLLEDARHG